MKAPNSAPFRILSALVILTALNIRFACAHLFYAVFADYLLDTIPDKVCCKAASKYEAALSKSGDPDPDFMEAVHDLTASACACLNPMLPDSPQIYYQSVGTKMNYASSGRFPLNIVYPMVKHFDGDNDRLVSVDSMK